MMSSDPAMLAFEMKFVDGDRGALDAYHAAGRFGVPCDCGEKSCTGFQMIHLKDRLLDAGWIPEAKPLLEEVRQLLDTVCRELHGGRFPNCRECKRLFPTAMRIAAVDA